MENNICLKDVINKIRKCDFVKKTIPLGFGPGLPTIQINNKNICVLVPFFKFVNSTELDKSLIFPIKYTVTALWPSGKIVGFEDLKYNPVFEKVDYTKPIGFFRHDAIKQYNSGQYRVKRDELLSMYDKFIDFLIGNTEFTEEDEEKFVKLLNIIIEPSLVPVYKVIDKNFSGKFID